MKSQKKASQIFNLDFASGVIAKYLDYVSLFRFGLICKFTLQCARKEVERRKGIVWEMAAKVYELTCKQMSMEQYDEAKALVARALEWIDSDEKMYHLYGVSVCCWEKQDWFKEERSLFYHRDWKSNGRETATLYVLPQIFYFTPGFDRLLDEESFTPTELANAKRSALFIWGAEDHMGPVYENYCMDPDFVWKEFYEPFHKFGLDGARFFTYECMHAVAMNIASSDTIDAFCLVARKMLFDTPNARDCLWYVIHTAYTKDWGFLTTADDSDSSPDSHDADDS